MSITLYGGRVLTAAGLMEHTTLVISQGRIAYLGPAESAPPTEQRMDVRGRIVAPGLVDIHVHGGFGITFGNDATLADDLRQYARQITTYGVTGFLCTLAAPDTATLLRLLDRYAELLTTWDAPGARPLGLHLEGPYLSREKKGAFNVAWLHDPTVAEVQQLLDHGRGWIRQITLAPELPHARQVAALLRRSGVVVALGHTNCAYEEAAAALRGDFTHVTHTFNAQRGFHHREPGVFGAVLTSEHATAELIADTIHVHPAAMQLLVRSLGWERIVLITDAMAAAGLGDGTYELVGHQVTVHSGVAREKDGTLAGSAVTLDACVRNMRQYVGVSPGDALRMASLNPARAMGLAGEVGVLAVGRRADVIVLNDALEVETTFAAGQRA